MKQLIFKLKKLLWILVVLFVVYGCSHPVPVYPLWPVN
jgi:hypothetical protein